MNIRTRFIERIANLTPSKDGEDSIAVVNRLIAEARRISKTKDFAQQTVDQLLFAYAQGERNGGTVDWSELDEAYQFARSAQRQANRKPKAKTSR